MQCKLKKLIQQENSVYPFVLGVVRLYRDGPQILYGPPCLWSSWWFIFVRESLCGRRLWCVFRPRPHVDLGSINRKIAKVHMSHFLKAYPTDPVPELSNSLTH